LWRSQRFGSDSKVFMIGVPAHFRAQHVIPRYKLEGEAGADSEGEIGKPCSNLLVRQNVVSVVTNNPEIGLSKPGKRICNMFA
jgi:hypothetical protein